MNWHADNQDYADNDLVLECEYKYFMMATEHQPGAVLEGNIAEWIADQNIVGVQRPYIWPGSWPDQDLQFIAREMVRPSYSIFDSSWIYYELWDPEIPGAIERFNRSQDRWHARSIHADGVWHPPRDLVAVLDRTRSDQVIMSMWLSLGERS